MCKHLRKFKLAVLYDCSSVYNFSRVIALNASLAGSFYLNWGLSEKGIIHLERVRYHKSVMSALTELCFCCPAILHQCEDDGRGMKKGWIVKLHVDAFITNETTVFIFYIIMLTLLYKKSLTLTVIWTFYKYHFCNLSVRGHSFQIYFLIFSFFYLFRLKQARNFEGSLFCSHWSAFRQSAQR